MFKNITEIKAANAAAGLHFFQPGAMRFFRSKVESPVIEGRVFVTSEQFVDHEGNADPRTFTVRRASDDGSIDTPSGFQAYSGLRAALAGARACADKEA